MFIKVLLLKGYSQPLLYAVPTELQKAVHIGSIVHVPIQKRNTSALVIDIVHNVEQTSFAIRSIQACQPLPDDKLYMPFIQQLAHYYQTQPLQYIKRIYQFIKQKPLQDTVAYYQPAHTYIEVMLTQEQQIVVNTLITQMEQQTFQANLLHGVTGSGKTEVYKKLLFHAYQQQKTALFLLPEVTLALQFENILKAQMPSEVPIYSFHCASSSQNKKIIWQKLLNQQPIIILGVHLPILLPVSNLGLIIVDEEHETGYQEKKHPKTNTREAALLRAHMYNIPILLGSATPCISSLYNVKKRGWNFFTLSKRFAGAFPTIKLVSLSSNKQRKNFWISKELTDEINKRLACNEQTILFLNRRGHSFFVQCKQCSFIFNCTNCSVSLTLHNNKQLLCHYCGMQSILPTACMQCKADEKDFIKKGIGTQQLMSIVQKLFPYARIARADMDTTSKKKEWQETITKFHNRELDILIGTQTITKGYDFAHVTLVGIIWADLNLHFPRYNATETTLQQLIQVAGRAGRKKDNSLVIVQTLCEHDAFGYLKETDYITFYEQEITTREQVGYPPCVRLAEIEFKHFNEKTVNEESKRCADELLVKIETSYPNIKLLGPAAPPISKIKNAHTRVIFLKHEHMRSLQELFQSIDNKKYKSTIYFTPNPQ